MIGWITLDGLISLLAGASATTAALTIVWPFLRRDRIAERLALMSNERAAIQRRGRARLATNDQKSNLGVEAKPLAQMIYERLNLVDQAEDSRLVQKLRMAGYRGKGRMITFLAVRVMSPFIAAGATGVYVWAFAGEDLALSSIWALIVMGAIAGYYAPSVYLQNRIAKRQLAIRRAWPDVLDLLLICVQAGMSLDSAIKKVADEMSLECIEAAEELAVLSAELSYLPDRAQAFENLASRTGLDCVKAVVTSLAQAEKYGTAVTQALRVLAQESRDIRMSEAEKKAAALPPKLTVPMIVFFLPVLFAVVLTPAIIQVMRL